MKPLNLCVIPSSYPSEKNPNAGIFVQTLLKKFVHLGTEVSVIAPTPKRVFNSPCIKQINDHGISVLRPEYISYSNKKLPIIGSTFKFTCDSFSKAATNCLNNLNKTPDAVYSHFMFPGGMTAVKISKNKSIPAFCALGEGNIKYYEEHMGLDKVKYIANNLAGIISVSRDNVDYCQSRLGIPSEKILFAPNAADTEIFFKRDKAEARKELSIPNDMNLIIFTGHFDNNKGALRVYKALEKCKNVYGAFLGSGSDNPEGEKVFFCGRVEHEKIPTWLSAADIFILPTIREASSNSVAEAAACGLPIITSDIPSMHDMTTDEFAIKVNAESVEKITDAIKMLISDKEKRNNFSSSALEHAKNYNLKTRAEKILNWITSKLKEKE